MRYQDHVVKATHRTFDDVCRAARAVPIEKHDWVPMGAARSVLSQMQEISLSGAWFTPILLHQEPPVFDEHAVREAKRLTGCYDTVEKCIEAANVGIAELCSVIESFPDELLESEILMPFGGGMILTMADVMSTPAWNMIYHLGQINYVQLMLGDLSMH